jgi:hypothetical protein
MKGINHLVLPAHNLEALRSRYQALGFTLKPRVELPLGVTNSLVQLQGSYLELLSVTGEFPEHSPGHFSFGAFNRDYLARHEGFSMLVLDTTDARADILSWRQAGFQNYAPFDFSRVGTTHNGEKVNLSFSLAFVTHPAAPWFGLFACQHYQPGFFAQPQYENHLNKASTVQDVWIVGQAAQDLVGFLRTVTGATDVSEGDNLTVLQTRIGAIVLAQPKAFEEDFGIPAPHPEDGPHLAGFTIGCGALDYAAGLNLQKVGDKYVVPPSRAFGTAIRFCKA